VKDIESLPKLRIKGTIAPYDPSLPFGMSFSSQDVINFLEENQDATDIVVEISSNGGSVSEGKEIYSRLRQSGKNITTVTYCAQSIATLFMLAGKKRLIVEGAEFRPHAARVYGEDLIKLGPLLAEDLDEISKEVKTATSEILDIFCKVLGEDKRSKLLATITADQNFGANGAIKLGFANGYYKKAEVEAFQPSASILMTAHLESIIKNHHMTDNKDYKSLSEEMRAGFKKFAQMLAGIKAEIKASVLLAGGGVSYSLEPSNPDAPDDLANAKIYLVDDAGLPTTNAPDDGEIVLDDGRVLVVVGGVVTEIKPAVDANALKAENEALKAEVEALKMAKEAEVAAVAKEVEKVKAEMSKKVAAIEMSYNELAKIVPGEPKTKEEKIEAPKKLTGTALINEARLKMEQNKLNIA
jgi:ATP-dependent protease ClpP protease subunit